MARAALGFRAHLGWAAAVAVGGPRRGPVVLERRRVSLVDPDVDVSHEPYHKAALVRDDEPRAREIVRAGRRAILSQARREIRALLRALEKDGHDVASAGVLLASGRSASFASTLASHALVHTAEGELMREALTLACEKAGLRVVGVRERELQARGREKLGCDEAALQRAVDALGAGLGPPWRQDQKHAALVAWLALAGLRA